MSVWDDPALKTSGDFVKFEQVGDRISGVVSAIRVQSFTNLQNGVPVTTVSPQIMLVTDDGEERTVTAGQVRLKAALAEERPEAGDHIEIELTQIEPRGGGKTLKHFDVKVRRAGGFDTGNVTVTPPGNYTIAPPSNTTIDSQAAAAAIAGLTAEQRKALGLPPF